MPNYFKLYGFSRRGNCFKNGPDLSSTEKAGEESSSKSTRTREQIQIAMDGIVYFNIKNYFVGNFLFDRSSSGQTSFYACQYASIGYPRIGNNRCIFRVWRASFMYQKRFRGYFPITLGNNNDNNNVRFFSSLLDIARQVMGTISMLWLDKEFKLHLAGFRKLSLIQLDL